MALDVSTYLNLSSAATQEDTAVTKDQLLDVEVAAYTLLSDLALRQSLDIIQMVDEVSAENAEEMIWVDATEALTISRILN